ncbi:MAG: peptidoglycan-binding protein [Saprospiraceae bacterium]
MFSSLQALIDANRDFNTDELNLQPNRNAALEIQTQLCQLGILDPIIDGGEFSPFGPIGTGDGQLGLNSRAALAEFCRLVGLPYVERHLSLALLQALAVARADTLTPLQLAPQANESRQTRLAKLVLNYLIQKRYWIARSPGMYNIVYVEGMNGDGSLNTDTLNTWNDRRMVIRIAVNGTPEMLVNDHATTEPGQFYTFHPLKPRGAARIAFGQYKAWVDGLHHNKQPALVQRERIRIHRDLNRDGLRNNNDPIDIGKTFGINQHTTSSDRVPDFVNSFSAGCLVGRRYQWHLSFLDIVRQDLRYQANKGYLFMTTIIAGDDLLRSAMT